MAIRSLEYTFFSAFDPTLTSYVFNSSGQTDPDLACFETRDFNRATIAVKVNTLASTNIIVALLGKIGGIWCLLIPEQTYTAAHTYGISLPVVIENPTHIALGVKVTGNAAGDSFSAAMELWNETYQ